MAENADQRTRPFSRQTVRLMLDLNTLLRSHGIRLSLSSRNVDQQLIQASENLDDEEIQALRKRLIEMQEPDISDLPQALEKPDLTLPDRRFSSGVETQLQGSYLDDTRDTRSRGILVEYLSLEKLQFRTQSEHDMALGDRLCVQFTLDEQHQTLLWQEIEIREVRDRTILAEFVGEGNANKVLGPFMEQRQSRDDDLFELQLE